MTSHDVVQVVRRGTGIRRAGHTGTLDPRASGVLVVLVGPAVRLSEFVSASDKRYQAIIRLGESTDTFDADGVITKTSPVNITYEQIEEALTQFEGTVEQVPPAYSAKKINGKKAYELKQKQYDLDLKLGQHAEEDKEFIITTNYILNLASRAYELFESSKVEQKR